MTAAAIALAIAFGGSQAAAKSPRVSVADIVGEWRGEYVCLQGVTALVLTLTPAPDGRLSGRFVFGPTPRNPAVPRGAFAMTGSFDVGRRTLRMTAGKWIERPSGYGVVDLQGQLNRSGARISGDVLYPGCGRFELSREPPAIG